MQPTPLYVTDQLSAYIERYDSKKKDDIDIIVECYDERANLEGGNFEKDPIQYSGPRLNLVLQLKSDGFDEIAKFLKEKKSYFYGHISNW